MKLPNEVFYFLKKLAAEDHNLTTQMTELDQARAAMAVWIEAFLKSLQKFDHHLFGLKVEDCFFESKREDGSLKNHFGAYFAFQGKWSDYAGYYLHIAPNSSYLGGGMYKPSAPVLRKIRQEIDFQPQTFESIISKKSFADTLGDLEKASTDKNPKGYPRDHPKIHLLRKQSFFVRKMIEDETFNSEDSISHCISIAKEIYPFNQFFNETFIS